MDRRGSVMEEPPNRRAVSDSSPKDPAEQGSVGERDQPEHAPRERTPNTADPRQSER